MYCLICNQLIQNEKGLSSHLRSKHDMTTREYYDTFIKKENEGICPICGNPTKYYNFTKGYNKHCSTRCSSLDPTVQEKLHNTNQELYGVNVGFQTELCVKNSHSKEAMAKRDETMLQRYNMHNCMNTEQTRKKKIQTWLKNYGVTNPYQIPEIRKKAIFNASTELAKQKMHDTRKLNGWNNNKTEDFVKAFFNACQIDYKYNYKSENYPWKVDFYLVEYDLYLELNLFWTHGHHWFDINSINDMNIIQQWLSKHNDFYDNAIKNWTIKDIQKRDWAIEHNLNFVVVWNKEQIDRFLQDLQDNKSFIGFIDYNEMNYGNNKYMQ